MSQAGVLRHRGLEAWLENTNGLPIALCGDVNINSNTISTWVNVTPRQFYTLRWRTSAGSNSFSALCEVKVKNDFHSVALDSELCVSKSIIYSRRRISQAKTTKGWLNTPYKRFGCLRICRRIPTNHDSAKELETQPGILSLGSLRLEIRRVSGVIHNNQVYWEGVDGKGVCVFDPDGIKVIDDAARGKPPWIIFEFKFREDPKITLRIIEENMPVDIKIGVNHSETSRKSSSARPDSDGYDQLDNSDDDFYYEHQISKTNVKTEGLSNFGADITQHKRSHDVNHSMEIVNSAKLHTSTSNSTISNKPNTSWSRPSQQVEISSYPALASSSSSLTLPGIPASNPLALPADPGMRSNVALALFSHSPSHNSAVPTTGSKRSITMAAEDDDIEFISWRPGKIRTKNIIQTAVKMENFENRVPVDPIPTVKREIKFEDDQLDCKMPIDEMIENYDALEHKKKELKQKLAEKMKAKQREIEELLRCLSD